MTINNNFDGSVHITLLSGIYTIVTLSAYI